MLESAQSNSNSERLYCNTVHNRICQYGFTVRVCSNPGSERKRRLTAAAVAAGDADGRAIGRRCTSGVRSARPDAAAANAERVHEPSGLEDGSHAGRAAAGRDLRLRCCRARRAPHVAAAAAAHTTGATVAPTSN